MHVIKTTAYNLDVILTPAEVDILSNIDQINEPMRTLQFEYLKTTLMLEILNVIGAPTDGT